MNIWKYPFEVVANEVIIPMPDAAQVLDVQMQHGQPCLWALVDPTQAPGPRRFRIYGTGQEIRPVGKYVGTFQMLDGDLILHMFEVT
jgi:hypothetical protein